MNYDNLAPGYSDEELNTPEYEDDELEEDEFVDIFGEDEEDDLIDNNYNEFDPLMEDEFDIEDDDFTF